MASFPRLVAIALLLSLCCVPFPSRAFNGEVVTEGTLTVEIGEVLPLEGVSITGRQAPARSTITLKNSGDSPLSLQLRAASVDGDIHITTLAPSTIEVPAQGTAEARCDFLITEKAEYGLYPLHIYATNTDAKNPLELHAVRIFSSESLLPPSQAKISLQKVTTIPDRGAVFLTSLHNQEVSYQVFGKDRATLSMGWAGSDPSGTHFSIAKMDRPDTRPSLTMHPPWRGAVGTMFVEYHLRLPETTPLLFSFAQAIRDSSPEEGKSDGVTFRVRIDGKVLFDRHSDTKTWLPGEVDLTPYAGKEITLGLECHPGPNKNTNCDSAFWGAPVIISGSPPPGEDAAATQHRADLAMQSVSEGKAASPEVFFFPLDFGQAAVSGNVAPTRSAALVPSPQGLLDAAIAFSAEGKTTLLHGFEIELDEQALGTWPSSALVEKVTSLRDESGVIEIAHQVRLNGQAQNITARIWAEGPALQVKIENNDSSSTTYITRVTPGSFNQKADRVYYGHGYCLGNPGKFTARGGGHDLSTSHVGMDFSSGLSLLVACDTPTDSFEVDPDRQHYALVTHPDCTFTLLPGAQGALACAVDYRSIDQRKAAPGVPSKAGRFVFDIWGGNYADIADRLERCFQYGLTDSMALIHAWQRWGYDYRLPDIFPPNPSLGSLEDMKRIGKVCTKAGVLWGLHDNYIDFYPDADEFSYDHIVFHRNGSPMKAWINESRDAQSYRFRPDHVRPFLERNLALMRDALHPSTSFVDVWASINAFDYYDRQGRFHPRQETRKAWGGDFQLIRETFGGTAPTTSEAGSDHLVGWLDGADCQFLQISKEGERFVPQRPCDDWQRVPWFDAVLHSRFSLHGVGYSNRYQGPLPRDLHGINSDDYISAEMLTGHALMVDASSLVRDAVRKYWLAQDVIWSLRQDDIASVAFADDSLHRQTVRWKSGAVIHVNRGESDWEVGGRTLPPYGFVAKSGDSEASIERIDGQVVEQSRSPGKAYFNGRNFVAGAPLDLAPRAKELRYEGDRKFELLLEWDAKQATEKDMAVFVHFRKTSHEDKDLDFAAGEEPSPGTSQWKGTITTGANRPIHLPKELGAGEYQILVGLYDRAGDSHRARLRSADDGSRRYSVGRLVVEGDENPGGKISAIRLISEQAPEPARLLPNPRPTDFGAVILGGGAQIHVEGKDILLTPLPDSPRGKISLRPGKFLGKERIPKRIESITADGKVLGEIDFQETDGLLSFTPSEDGFAFRIRGE